MYSKKNEISDNLYEKNKIEEQEEYRKKLMIFDMDTPINIDEDKLNLLIRIKKELKEMKAFLISCNNYDINLVDYKKLYRRFEELYTLHSLLRSDLKLDIKDMNIEEWFTIDGIIGMLEDTPSYLLKQKETEYYEINYIAGSMINPYITLASVYDKSINSYLNVYGNDNEIERKLNELIFEEKDDSIRLTNVKELTGEDLKKVELINQYFPTKIKNYKKK